MLQTLNIQETNGRCLTEVLPRSAADLRSWLHGYRLRSAGNLARSTRASIIIGGLDEGHSTPMMKRAARELAGLDPSLSWLPDWKPRVAVKGGG